MTSDLEISPIPPGMHRKAGQGTRRSTAVALLLAIGISLVPPAAVSAECMGQTNVFPPLGAVAPTADVVAIGTVERMEGVSGGPLFVAFWLRVEEPLVGEPGERIRVYALQSGLPLQGQEACRHDAVVYARPGDRLAIALDGTYDGHRHVNTVAWIGKRPNDLTRAQTITLRQARRAVLVPPETSTASATSLLDRVVAAVRTVALRLADWAPLP